jgi:hypothetical protein
MWHSPDEKIKDCLQQLGHRYAPMFGKADHHVEQIVAHAARFSLNTIATSDAPYHDVDHTKLATLAGQAILEGLLLSGRAVTKLDWAHFTIALLFHDIGYMRGICKGDQRKLVATGRDGEFIKLTADSTDAALSPYHVDRSLMFVRERFSAEFDRHGVLKVDAIQGFIEKTRFPFPSDGGKDDDSLGELVRAADLIGQLGDPNRLQKCLALFKEFEEIGLNARLGYRRPEDLRRSNTSFYYSVAAPHIQRALAYLKHTAEGRQWLCHLQENVGGHIM